MTPKKHFYGNEKMCSNNGSNFFPVLWIRDEDGVKKYKPMFTFLALLSSVV